MYTSQHYRLEDAVTGSFPRQIKGTERRIAAYEQDIQTAKSNQTYDADNKLVCGIELNGIHYDKREDAGKALLGLIGAAVRSEKPVPVVHYAGFEITVEYKLLNKVFEANLVIVDIPHLYFDGFQPGQLRGVESAVAADNLISSTWTLPTSRRRPPRYRRSASTSIKLQSASTAWGRCTRRTSRI